MNLGAFSVSLAVKDLEASRKFYEKFGFTEFHGDAAQNWLILKNGETTIGLFHGMFDRNMLTFNPGLTPRMERLERYTDVRAIADRLRAAGIEVDSAIEPDSAGPGSITVIDPDGTGVPLTTTLPVLAVTARRTRLPSCSIRIRRLPGALRRTSPVFPWSRSRNKFRSVPF